MVLELKHVMENNLIRVATSSYFQFNNHFNQLYISNKTGHFMISYEGACSIHVSRHLKERFVWSI